MTKQVRILTMILSVSFISGCLESASPNNSSTAAKDTSASAPNNAPTISGSPDTAILVGDVYSFSPVASDSDRDALTFSIANKPYWGTFDSETGRLSGQVFLGDVGVYDRIRISVSDGTVSSALPEFSITVTQTALGSMTLSWTAPTENTDGTPLTDLAGYNIYFGKSQGSYPNQVRIDNPSVSTYVVENLVPDTYYITATSFNAVGVESEYSNVAQKTVQSN